MRDQAKCSLQLLEVVSNKYRALCDQLDQSDLLDSYLLKNNRDAVEVCRDAFLRWIKDNGTKKYPMTWQGLIELLEALNCSQAGIKLKEGLESQGPTSTL